MISGWVLEIPHKSITHALPSYVATYFLGGIFQLSEITTETMVWIWKIAVF